MTHSKSVGQPVIERVEHQTDPKVLFYEIGGRIEPVRRRFKYVPLVLFRKSEKGFERSIHTAIA